MYLHNRQGGFSLIELVLVMALIGVVAFFSMGASLDAITRNTVTQERDLFVTLMLRSARAAALANTDQVSHGIRIDNTNHEYVLFDGTTYNAGNASNRHIPFSSPNLSVTNTGGNTIVFEQLSGDVLSGSGTTTIANGSKNQKIIIRSTGQIDW